MLQQLRVVQGYRYMAGVFDAVLYNFTHNLEDNVSHLFANAIHQTKMFMRARDN
jgi:hypothetical protein